MKELVRAIEKPFSKMDDWELKAEGYAQRDLRQTIERRLYRLERMKENGCKKWRIREVKIALCHKYITALRALDDEIEYQRKRTCKGKHDEAYDTALAIQIKEKNDRYTDKTASLQRDGIGTNWDKEKFVKVCKDRGYATNISIIYAIKDELGLDRARAERIFNSGRFTWGQTICVAAMLEMTPREFCDIFLSGCFVERGNAYVASYANVNKKQLLKLPVVPKKDGGEE